jgi:hypothetical protein
MDNFLISEFNLKIYKQREFTLLVIPIKKKIYFLSEDFKKGEVLVQIQSKK